MNMFIKFFSSRFVLLVGCALSLATLPIHAADEDAFSKVRTGLAEIGKQWNSEVAAATSSLFIELHQDSDRSGVTIVSDISYGSHALQGVDIVMPDRQLEELLPVVVFVHGGGLVRGDKLLAGTDLVYSNIATYFARNGMVGVNANYRLAPEVSWPAGPEDVRDMLAWLRENIEDYGGDPKQLFVMANSAGGRIVASYLFHEPFHFSDGPGVSGALLSSASFGGDDSQVHRDYYGEDEAVREGLIPLGLIDSYYGPEIPVFMWSAEFDPTRIEAPIAAMYSKLCQKYKDCPRFTQFQGHNHVSHIMSLNSVNEEVGVELLEFIRSVTD
jgi:acetyl esterase